MLVFSKKHTEKTHKFITEANFSLDRAFKDVVLFWYCFKS
jgi:hypothetical protein